MGDLDIMRQRVPLDTCARCRKKIKAGERVMPAYIVVKSAVRHPETKELVSEMSGEFEFIHGSCIDPYLDGKTLLIT